MARNRDLIASNWQEIKADLNKAFDKLTPEELDQTEGSREKLQRVIERRYGVDRDEADRQLESWRMRQANL